MDYDGDYGDYGPRQRNGGNVHQVRFLASRKMGPDEPSPQQVLNEVRRVINEYKYSRNKPRKYSIAVSSTEVIIRELESFHDENIQTKFIHYCVHDEDYPNIFAFVAWSQSQNCFLSHIFYCRDESEAANLKASFANGFQAAYKDYKQDARGPPRRQRDTYSEYAPPKRGRDSYSEYAPARLTRGVALDHHRRSYEAPAVMEREHYHPPARISSRPRPRQQQLQPRPRPNQVIEVYGDPRAGYDFDDADDDYFQEAPPPPRQPPAPVEKEVVYTRETFPAPSFGHEGGFDRRRPAGYDDGGYGGGARRGRQSRRYVEDGYARDDMLF